MAALHRRAFWARAWCPWAAEALRVAIYDPLSPRWRRSVVASAAVAAAPPPSSAEERAFLYTQLQNFGNTPAPGTHPRLTHAQMASLLRFVTQLCVFFSSGALHGLVLMLCCGWAVDELWRVLAFFTVQPLMMAVERGVLRVQEWPRAAAGAWSVAALVSCAAI